MEKKEKKKSDRETKNETKEWTNAKMNEWKTKRIEKIEQLKNKERKKP